MQNRKVIIAIPTYNGEISATTMMSVHRAIREAEAAGWVAEFDIRANDSFTTRARNCLVADFMASDASDLVFWDADIAVLPGAFARLLTHDVDIVGGVYRLRNDPERYPVRPLPSGLNDDPDTDLIEVEGIATGFMRIRRRAIEKMIAHFPDLWVTESGRKVAWLFDYAVIDHQFWSEDYIFCRRWREAGGRIWADPWPLIVHTGPKSFVGHWARSLGRRRAALVSPADLVAAHAKVDRWIAEFEGANS